MNKKILTTLALSAFCFVGLSQDLEVGNVSAGIDSYDQNTGTINGVYFDILNNEGTDAGSFRIAIFLADPVNFDPQNPSTYHEINSITDSDGQSGNTIVTYSSINIDINDTPNVPAGDYRVLVCVDEDGDVSESDESNNCLYITTQGNNITYTPGAATAINESEARINISGFPNPVGNQFTLKIEDGPESGSVQVYNVMGELVDYTAFNNSLLTIQTDALREGTYVYAVKSKTGAILYRNTFVKL